VTSTVLITGASQGIGKATAILFAQKGYDVVLAARNADRLTTTAQEIQDLGRSALAVPTDVKQPQQVSHLISRALAEYGSIDVLVNNAGIYSSGPAAQFSLEDWHEVIDINLWGYIHTIHALLPHFLQQRSGTIVNVCSVGGKIAIPYLAPYSTSKFAVAGLTQALHTELEPKGIHVAGIYPNLIKSSFLERAIFRGNDPEDTIDRKKQIQQILQIPFVESPNDVAQAIWSAVKQRRAEVVVGSAKLTNTLPGLIQRLMRPIFQHKD
jgi:short-subunit dehydrogenase